MWFGKKSFLTNVIRFRLEPSDSECREASFFAKNGNLIANSLEYVLADACQKALNTGLFSQIFSAENQWFKQKNNLMAQQLGR